MPLTVTNHKSVLGQQ